jgi:hypothetical protein
MNILKIPLFLITLTFCLEVISGSSLSLSLSKEKCKISDNCVKLEWFSLDSFDTVKITAQKYIKDAEGKILVEEERVKVIDDYSKSSYDYDVESEFSDPVGKYQIKVDVYMRETPSDISESPYVQFEI